MCVCVCVCVAVEWNLYLVRGLLRSDCCTNKFTVKDKFDPQSHNIVIVDTS